jgi:hypothetical protein
MRNILSFLCAIALLVAGLWLLYHDAFVATKVISWTVLMGAFLTYVGGAWLWSDFIGPLVGSAKGRF